MFATMLTMVAFDPGVRGDRRSRRGIPARPHRRDRATHREHGPYRFTL
ncbi:MAG: hypothetical protein U0168_08630 [Nannocystaceae bacterium]